MLESPGRAQERRFKQGNAHKNTGGAGYFLLALFGVGYGAMIIAGKRPSTFAPPRWHHTPHLHFHTFLQPAFTSVPAQRRVAECRASSVMRRLLQTMMGRMMVQMFIDQVVGPRLDGRVEQ